MKNKIVIGILVLMSIILVACSKSEDNFEETTYKVTVIEPEHGAIKIDKSEVYAGESVLVNLTANSGYYLQDIYINDKKVEHPKETFTYADIQSNIKIEAIFSIGDIKVTLKTTQEEFEMNVAYDDLYGLLPTPKSIDGKRFAGWYHNNRHITSNSIVETNKNHHLDARWLDDDHPFFKSLDPRMITVGYYDGLATMLGVSYHTNGKPMDGMVQISEGSKLDLDNMKYYSFESEAYRQTYINQTVIRNLEFDTEYTYRIGDHAADIWTDEITIKTRKNSDESSFLYLSDTQQAGLNSELGLPYTGYKKVLEEATKKFDFEYIVHGGDFVEYGGDFRYWEEMLEDIQPYIMKYPTIVTIGNHESPDYYATNVSNLYDKMFKINAPQQSGTDYGNYFSLDIGQMHLVVLRSNDAYNTPNGTILDEQLNWLDEDLAANKNNPDTIWTVVLIHESPIRPIASTQASNNHMQGMRQPLIERFRKGEVDLVLFGHDHYHSVSYPLEYTDEIFDLDNDGLTDYVNVVAKPDEVNRLNVDGDVVDTYPSYQSGKEGTIFYQAGTAGIKYNTDFNVSNLNKDLEDIKYLSMIRSGGAGRTFEGDPRAYMFYAYIEITNEHLTIRNYAVFFNEIYPNDIQPNEGSKFVYGIRITKDGKY